MQKSIKCSYPGIATSKHSLPEASKEEETRNINKNVKWQNRLTLKAPVTTAADDNFFYFYYFLFFRENKSWHFMWIICQVILLISYAVCEQKRSRLALSTYQGLCCLNYISLESKYCNIAALCWWVFTVHTWGSVESPTTDLKFYNMSQAQWKRGPGYRWSACTSVCLISFFAVCQYNLQDNVNVLKS